MIPIEDAKISHTTTEETVVRVTTVHLSEGAQCLPAIKVTTRTTVGNSPVNTTMTVDHYSPALKIVRTDRHRQLTATEAGAMLPDVIAGAVAEWIATEGSDRR